MTPPPPGVPLSSSPPNFRPLLPASAPVSVAAAHALGAVATAAASNSQALVALSHGIEPVAKKKRIQVAVACERCRKKKIRCDGVRPTCGTCSARQINCQFEPDDAAGGQLARAQVMKRRYDALTNDNAQLRELYDLMRVVPEHEAVNIVRKIRSARDPLDVLFEIKERMLLLPTMGADIPRSPSPIADPNAKKLDTQCLSEAIIRVPARPWTNVADDGFVSWLVSQFFLWDSSYMYPFVDQDCFITDMRSQDPLDAQYCSPFLVNAICAVRCYTSERARQYGFYARQNMPVRFADEAKRFFELEFGRASLVNVQGLVLLFITCALSGRDRAGQMYRFAAFEMLKRLDLERKFHRLQNDDPDQHREKRAIARMLWGLHASDGIMSYSYLQPSLMKSPTIPKPIDPDVGLDAEALTRNVDVFGQPFNDKSIQPPFIPGFAYVMAEIAEMQSHMIAWDVTNRGNVGTPEDFKTRKEFYDKLVKWYRGLPRQFRSDSNFTPETCFLTVHYHETIVGVLRPMHPDVVVEGTKTVMDLLLQYCEIDVTNLERVADTWRFKEYTAMVFPGPYNAIITTAPWLRDNRSHAIFTRAAGILAYLGKELPMPRQVLRGVRALTYTLKVPIPQMARRFFENLGRVDDDPMDVPMEFILPDMSELRQLLADEGQDTTGLGAHLGALIVKWDKLTIS